MTLKNITHFFLLFSFFLTFKLHAQVPDICWQQNYGSSGGELSVCVEKIPGGGMLIAFGSSGNDVDIIDTVTWHGDYDVVIMQLDACGKIEWQRVYGGTGTDLPYAIKRLSDGSIFLGCQTYSPNGEALGSSTRADLWGLKLDAFGNLIWSRTIGTPSHHEYGGYMDVASNGDMLITGIAGLVMGLPYYHGNNDAMIIRLDGTTGTPVWGRAYGGPGGERGYWVTGTYDNGGILLSTTDANGGYVSGFIGSTDLWVVKIDSTNAIQWQKCLGGTGNENTEGTIVQSSDSSYYVIGSTQSTDSMAINNHGGNDVFITKLDSLGNILWTNCYGGSGSDVPGARGGKCAIESSDGNLVVLANTNSNDGDVSTRYLNQDLWLFKIDKNTGTIIWEKTFGSDFVDLGYSVDEVSPGNFVLSANTNASNSVDFDQATYGATDAWIMRISEDCLGELEDSLSYINNPTTCNLSNGDVGITVHNRLLSNSYSWVPIPSADSLINNIAAGTYTVSVTDFIGCSDTFPVTVYNIPDTIPPTFTCLNDTTISMDTTCSYTVPNFLTSPALIISDNCDAISDLTIYQIPVENTTITSDTMVWIFVADTSGNIDSCSFNITLAANIPPDAGILSGNQSICIGNTTTFTTTGQSGGTWSSSNTGVVTVNASGMITGIAIGTATITYTVTGPGGCSSATATRTINVRSLSFSDFHTSTINNCSSDTLASISFTIHTTDYPVNYWFYNSTDTFFTGTAFDIGNLQLFDSLLISSGDYQITLENQNNCSYSMPVNINHSVLGILVQDSVGYNSLVCSGDSTDVYVRVRDGVGPYDFYLMSGNDTIDVHQVVLDSFTVFQHVPAGNYSVTVIDLGIVPWHHLIGGSARERGAIYEDNYGNTIVVGGTESSENSLGVPIGGVDGYILKMDAQGNILWKRRYGTTGPDYLMGIKQMTNGDYVALGYKNIGYISGLNTGHNTDIWFLRIDANGNVIADQTYIANGWDMGYDIVEKNNGDLFIAGVSRSVSGAFTGNHGGIEDGLIIRTDPFGSIQWSKLYGSSGQDGFGALTYLHDSTLVAVGWSGANNGDVSGYQGGGVDGWIVRIDESNTLISQQSYGGSNYDFFNAIKPKDGLFYFLGTTSSANGDIVTPTYGGQDGLVAVFDETTLSVVNQIILGGAGNDLIGDIVILNNDAYFGVGEKTTSSLDMWTFGLNTSGAIIYENTYGGNLGNTAWATYEGATRLFANQNGYLIGGVYASPNGDFSGNHGGEDAAVFQLGVKYCDAFNFTIIEPTLPSDTIAAILCPGDSILIGGTYYNAIGNYQDTILTALGCDSVLYITLYRDTINPVITTCAPDTLVDTDGNCQFILPDFTTAISLVVTDNCSTQGVDLIVSQSPTPGTVTTTNTIVWLYATDASGNIDSCSFTVTLNDTIDPIITNCLSDTTLSLSANCDVIVPDYTNSTDFTVTDNCSTIGIDLVITQSPLAGTAIAASTTVWLYATDGNGNMDSCNFNLTLIDNSAPQIVNCISDQVLTVDNNCNSEIPDYTSHNELIYSDNCSAQGVDLIVTQSVPAGTIIATDTIVWLYVTDAAGNVDSCSFTITVSDCGITIYESFSPNGNGQNEYFFVENLDAFPNSSVIIFNRWGTEVYQSDNYQNDWNGISQSKYNIAGNELPEGTYYYILTLGGDVSNPSHGKTYKGYVYLKK